MLILVTFDGGERLDLFLPANLLEGFTAGDSTCAVRRETDSSLTIPLWTIVLVGDCEMCLRADGVN